MMEGQTAAVREKKSAKIMHGQMLVLKIELKGITPGVWRTVRVPQDLSLGGLHWVIQFAMGWTNSHLHQFLVKTDRYSDLRFELDEYGDDIGDEDCITVREALPRRRSKMDYEYDFGDNWNHTVTFVDAVDPVDGEPALACLGGEQACPPEDCGGIWGFKEMLKTLAKPNGHDRETYLEWLGGQFDPNKFSVEKANREIQRLRLAPRVYIDVIPPRQWRWWESE